MSTYVWLPRLERSHVWSEASRNYIGTAWACALIALVLAIPAVARTVGVSTWVSAPVVLSYSVVSLIFLFWNPDWRGRPRLRMARLLFEVVHGVSLITTLVVASDNPMTPLWALGTAYAALDGSDFEFPPLVSHVALHTLAPLVAIPFFLTSGQPASVAIGVPAFFAVVNFVAYHYTAARKGGIRLAFTERDALLEQLVVQRASIERERIVGRLVDSVGARLAATEEHLGTLRTEGNPQLRLLAQREIAEAAREGLAELRVLLSGLDADPEAASLAESAPIPSEPVYRNLVWTPSAQLAVSGTRADLVSAIWLSLLVAGVLAIPQVAGVFDLRRSIALPAVLLFPLWILGNLVFPVRNSPFRWTSGRFVCTLLLGVGICCALPAASGNPQSPLWCLAIMYAVFNSSEFEVHASYVHLLAHVGMPLLTIPVFLLLGAEPAAAVGGPILFAVLCFIFFHFGAVRSRTGRAVRAERERLASQLAHERSARDRERIARDLHDSLGAQLSLAAVYADLLERRRDDPRAVKLLSEAMAEAAEQSLLDLRELIEGLAPEDLSLAELISQLRGRCERLASAASIRIDVRAGGQAATLSPAARYGLLRISQEALCNAVRHARAQAIEIELSVAEEYVRLSVTDDGRGFDPQETSTGRGLNNMRRRASELGGTLQVSSGARGTTIEAQVSWA